MAAKKSRSLTPCGYHLDLRRPVPPAGATASWGASDAHTTRDFAFVILRAGDGDKYMVVSDGNGSYGLPYRPRVHLDGDVLTRKGGERVRGYLALDEIAQEARGAQPHVPQSPPHALLAHAAAAAAGPGASAPGPSFTASEPAFALSPLQTQMLSTALTNLIGDGKPFGQIGAASTLLGLLGPVLGQQVGQLLQDAAPLDDESSQAEYLAAIAAQRAVGEVQAWLTAQFTDALGLTKSSSLADKLQAFFEGETSNAQLAASRDGDAHDGGGVVLAANEANVLVEGKPLATAYSADLVLPQGAPIVNGSLTVLAKDRLVARVTSETGAPSALATGAPSVLVGGPGLAPEVAAIAQQKFGAPFASAEAGQTAVQQMHAAQVEYERALAHGQSSAAAIANAEVAANRLPLTDKQRMLLTNAAYADRRDFRGLELVRDENGKRVFSLDDHGPQSHETYDLRVDDTVVIDGHAFTVQKINNDASTGYQSMWFVDEASGQALLVVQGTNEGRDWYDNIAQGLGALPPQYQQVLEDAAAFQAQYPGGELAGHSLGGGLAAFAGFVTGLTTTAYNAAGLGQSAVDLIHTQGVPAHLADVTQIQISHEILSGIGEFLGAPATAGQLIEISPVSDFWSSTGWHAMPEIIMATTGRRVLLLQSGDRHVSLPGPVR